MQFSRCVASGVWNPQQYLKFADVRLRPALDLLARIDNEAVSTVCDLGCGTGSVIGFIQQKWKHAKILGIDSSEEMLESARHTFDEDPTIDFELADIKKWEPRERLDLIFSNAALHWIDDDELLYKKLSEFLTPYGTLAVQMPKSHDLPSHRLMREVAQQGEWSTLLEDVEGVMPLKGHQTYYDILSRYFKRVDMWETTYIQVLEGENPVMEFTRGSGLRPYLDPLPPVWREQFLEEYGKKLDQTYEKQSDGKTLFPFPRFFFVCRYTKN